jgi:urease beta subunit
MGGVSLTAGNVDQFALVIDPDTVNEEVVFATQVSTDTFVVVRGRAGTSAVGHNTGAVIKHALTGEDLTYFTAGIINPVITTKGDLVVGTGSGVFTRLGVGTDTQVLIADSTQTSGVKWGTVSSYAAPTLGSTSIPSGTTVTNVTGLTLTNPTIVLSINAQVGTTYTFVVSDAAAVVTASNAAAQTYNIPLNSAVAYPIGSQISLIQIGAGQVTIQGISGVTVASASGTPTTPKLRTQYSAATLIKVATDTWYVVGDIA